MKKRLNEDSTPEEIEAARYCAYCGKRLGCIVSFSPEVGYHCDMLVKKEDGTTTCWLDKEEE